MGKKRKNIWFAAPMCLFWIVWQDKNRVVFENRATSDQRTKVIFLSNLWSWANIHSVDNTNSLVNFLAWLECRWFVFCFFSFLVWAGRPLGCGFVLLSLLLSFWVPFCILPVYFLEPFGSFFLNIFASYLLNIYIYIYIYIYIWSS